MLCFLIYEATTAFLRFELWKRKKKISALKIAYVIVLSKQC